MTTQIVSSFAATLGVKIDQRSFAASERALKRIQEIMAGFAKYKTDLVISPKIKFNTLNLQREAQRSLNQVSRLLEVKLTKFSLDPSQLTRSLDSAIRRAQFSANSIKVRAVVERSPVSQAARRVAQSAGSSDGAGGVAGLVGASRAGVAGIAGYVGYQGVQQLNDQINGIQGRVVRTDTARMLLGQAVGGSKVRQSNAADWYKQTTNKYGIDAEGGISDFNTALVLQRGQGVSTRDALKNYDSFLQRFTLRHLSSDQQKGSLRQITQIMGRGTVQAEDLNSLVENGDPEIKNLIREAWARRTGYKGTNQAADYASAQKKGQVTSDDLLGAYAISAKRNAAALEESSRSLRAEAQRTANSKFWADMERNSEELTRTLEDRNKAEQELYAASVPLQTMFTKLVEIPVIERLTEFTTGLTGIAKWFDKYQSLPESQKNQTLIDGGIDAAKWAGKRLASNNLFGWAVDGNWLGAGDAYNSAKNYLLGPQYGVTPGYRQVPDFQSYQPSELLNNMRGGNTTNTNQQMVQIAPGAFSIEINTTGDVNAISSELERSMSEITDRVLLNKLSEARFQYPAIGR